MKRIFLVALLTVLCFPAFAGGVGLRGTLLPSARSAEYDADSNHCQASQVDEGVPWGVSYEAQEGYKVVAYLVLDGQMQPLASTVVKPERAKGFLQIPHVTWPPNTEAKLYFTIEDSHGTVVDEEWRGQYHCTAG